MIIDHKKTHTTVFTANSTTSNEHTILQKQSILKKNTSTKTKDSGYSQVVTKVKKLRHRLTIKSKTYHQLEKKIKK